MKVMKMNIFQMLTGASKTENTMLKVVTLTEHTIKELMTLTEMVQELVKEVKVLRTEIQQVKTNQKNLVN